MKRKINHLLVERRWQRKALLSLILLSFLIVIGVGAMLVMPAISMETTADKGGTTIPYAVVPAGAVEFQPTIQKVTASTSGSKLVEREISVNFTVDFELQPYMFTGDNHYIYYDLNKCISEEEGSFDIPDGGIPADNQLGVVTVSGVGDVGTYRIEDNGLIVIWFNDDLYNVMNKDGANPEDAHLEFTAGVVRAEGNDSDDITLKFGDDDSLTTTVTLSGFLYGNVDLTKETPTLSEDKKTVTWTIKVSNPDGSNLEGLVITDSMLEGAKNIVCDYGEVSGGKIVLGKTSAENIVITYETDLTDDYAAALNGETLKNTAILKKSDDTELDKDTKSIYIPSSVSVSKSGSAEYNETDDVITWTVTISNPNSFNLKGYQIVDSKFSKLSFGTDFNISGITSYSTSGDTLTINNDYTGDVTLTYTTTVDKSDSEPANSADYRNSVYLKAPDNKTQTNTQTATVPTSQFTISKDGQKTDNGLPQISWTITITDKVTDDSENFNTLTITDDVLLKTLNSMESEEEQKNALSIVGTTESWTQNTVSYEFIKENNQITGIHVTDDSVYKNIVLSYTTSATESSYSTADANGIYTTVNTAGIDSDTLRRQTVTSTVKYSARSDVTKKQTNISQSEDGKLYIDWEVHVKGEAGSFTDGIQITDVMTATALDDDVTQALKEIQSISLIDSEKATTDLSKKKYTVSKTENGFDISIDSTQVSQSTLDSTVEVVVTYRSVISLANISSGTEITYSNTASALSVDKMVNGSYTVKSDKRLQKSMVDGDEVDLENVETKTIDIDGVSTECYIFQWEVKLNENGEYTELYCNAYKNLELTDKLPEGFRLYSAATVSDGFYSLYVSTNNKHEIEKGTSSTGSNPVSYIVDENAGTVTFNVQWWAFLGNDQQIIYYLTYIPKTEFDSQISDDGDEIVINNEISDSDDELSVASVTIDPGDIRPPVEDNTIRKSVEKTEAGAVTYCIDVNPESADLNPNGNTVDLQDVFKFGSVGIGTDGTTTISNPADLLHVTLGDISFVKVTVDSETGEDIESDISSQVKYTFSSDGVAEENKEMSFETVDSLVQSTPTYARKYKLGSIDQNSYITVKLKSSSDNVNIGSYVVYGYNADDSTWQSWVAPNECTYILNQDGDTYQFQIRIAPNKVSPVDVYLGYGNDSSLDSVPEIESVTVTTYEKDADAILNMTIPDNTHVKILYTYKATSNQIQSVANTSNKISVVGGTESQTDTQWVDYQAYQKSSASVEAKYIYLTKTDAADNTKKLTAGFQLMRYNSSTKVWEYAQGKKANNNRYDVTEWDVNEPTEAVFKTGTEALAITVESGYVYYLKEVEWPDGYDDTISDNQYFVFNETVASVSLPSVGAEGELLVKEKIASLSPADKVTINNKKVPTQEYTLPETGGTGTGVYVTIGAFITIIAAFILGVRRRKAVYDKV
jgi:LPXTG-motif cell wall-anchored protein